MGRKKETELKSSRSRRLSQKYEAVIVGLLQGTRQTSRIERILWVQNMSRAHFTARPNNRLLVSRESFATRQKDLAWRRPLHCPSGIPIRSEVCKDARFLVQVKGVVAGGIRYPHVKYETSFLQRQRVLKELARPFAKLPRGGQHTGPTRPWTGQRSRSWCPTRWTQQALLCCRAMRLLLAVRDPILMICRA